MSAPDAQPARTQPRLIEIGGDSWDVGYSAGLDPYGPAVCPGTVPDELSCYSGYIEGKPARCRVLRS